MYVYVGTKHVYICLYNNIYTDSWKIIWWLDLVFTW